MQNQGRTIGFARTGGGVGQIFQGSRDITKLSPPPLWGGKVLREWGKVLKEGGKHLLPSFIMICVVLALHFSKTVNNNYTGIN